MLKSESQYTCAVLGAVVAASLLLAFFVPAPAGAADVSSIWNGTAGNWTDLTRWSSNPLYPDNGNGGFTYDATINSGPVTQNLPAGITIEKLTFGGGVITGDYDLAVNNLLTWTGGTMSGTGTTYANGGMLLSGTTELDERTLVNAGIAVWTAGDLQWRSSYQRPAPQFNNLSGATFEIRTDGTVYYSGPPYAVPVIFNNSGTVAKLSSTGTTTFNGVLNNTGTVQVDSGVLAFGRTFIQTAGTTIVRSSLTISPNALNLQGGRLYGGGTVTGSVSNVGADVEPGNAPGTLAITGSYTQGASGKLSIDLAGAGAGQFDVLQVTGVATLAGELHIRTIGQDIQYVPPVGTEFTILTCGSRSGTFSNVTGSGQYQVTYGATNVKIKVLVPPNPGDINGDGDVDVVDLLDMVYAFGTVLTDAGYDPDCDLNGDGSVDVVDLLILVGVWPL